MLCHLAASAIVLFLVLADGRAQPETVRLAGGSDPRAGRVEIYHNGTWGTVCRDFFGNAAARVVCRMLGYGRRGRYIGQRYGAGGGPIWLDNVRCSDAETSVTDCPHSGWGDHNCDHSEDVSVSCVPDSAEAAALVGGGNPRVGRLELFHGGQWGTVCGDGFTDAAARVACYSLGFGYVGRKVDVDRYGAGNGLIWLRNVFCRGTERHVGECTHDGWTAHSCSHGRDVAIACTGNASVVTPVRLVGGSSSRGRLEVFHAGAWGAVCGRYFASASAGVACSALGLGPGSRIDGRNYTAASDGPIWLDGVRCDGTETDIADCPHGGWGVHDCQLREAVAISCAGTHVAVRLNGGRDPREGRLEVSHDGAWRSVCRGGFGVAEATVVCYSLGFGHVGRPTSNDYGRGAGQLRLLRSVRCRGTERNFAECLLDGSRDLGDCSSGDELAVVSCLADDAVGLFGGESPREGRLELYHNGRWGTVCNDRFTNAAARVACYSLGFGHVGGKKSVRPLLIIVVERDYLSGPISAVLYTSAVHMCTCVCVLSLCGREVV